MTNEEEKLDNAIKQAMALGRALDNLSEIVSSIGSDNLFEVIATQVLKTASENGEDESISAADVARIVDRLNTYLDGARILQLIFSGIVTAKWDRASCDLKLCITAKGKAKAEEIFSRIDRQNEAGRQGCCKKDTLTSKDG